MQRNLLRWEGEIWRIHQDLFLLQCYKTIAITFSITSRLGWHTYNRSCHGSTIFFKMPLEQEKAFPVFGSPLKNTLTRL